MSEVWRGIKTEFSCAHFYHQRRWSNEKNREVFGKCFTEHGHGHDYVLEIEFLESEIELRKMQETVRALREELDHQHVNFVIPEFLDQIPTTENMTLFCLDRLHQTFGKSARLKLKLWERHDLASSVEN